MGTGRKRAGVIAGGVIGGGIVFSFLQMLAPFPFGLYLGITLFSIIVGICVVIAVVAIKKDRRTAIEEDANVKVIAILKERLAKGEISKEEYDNLFEKLSK